MNVIVPHITEFNHEKLRTPYQSFVKKNITNKV